MESNDPENPTTRITLKMNIKTVFTLQPDRISFTAYEKKGAEREVTVKHSDGKPFKIKGIEGLKKGMSWSLTPEAGTEVSGDQLYTLTIKIDPDVKESNLRGDLTILTDFSESPNATVSYYVRISPLVSAIPETVKMNIRTQPYQGSVIANNTQVYKQAALNSEIIHSVPANMNLNIRGVEEEWFKVWIPGIGEGWVQKQRLNPVYPGTSYSISVRKHEGVDFKVFDVKTDLDIVEYEVKSIKEGENYQIYLQYTGEVKEGLSYKGTVSMSTNDAEYPTLTVPVEINIMSRKTPPKRPSLDAKAKSLPDSRSERQPKKRDAKH